LGSTFQNLFFTGPSLSAPFTKEKMPPPLSHFPAPMRTPLWSPTWLSKARRSDARWRTQTRSKSITSLSPQCSKTRSRPPPHLITNGISVTRTLWRNNGTISKDVFRNDETTSYLADNTQTENPALAKVALLSVVTGVPIGEWQAAILCSSENFHLRSAD